MARPHIIFVANQSAKRIRLLSTRFVGIRNKIYFEFFFSFTTAVSQRTFPPANFPTRHSVYWRLWYTQSETRNVFISVFEAKISRQIRFPVFWTSRFFYVAEYYTIITVTQPTRSFIGYSFWTDPKSEGIFKKKKNVLISTRTPDKFPRTKSMRKS